MSELIKDILCKGVNFYYIPIEKFKTFNISINIHNQLCEEDATINALLACILKRGSKDYANIMEMAKKLENLYGASIKTSIDKKGENQIVRFSFDGIEDRFIIDNNSVFEELVKFAASVLLNPLIDKNGFREEYITQEKEKLKDLIAGLINNKMTYAVERCYQEMCKGEKFGIYELGNIDNLDSISNKDLVTQYNRIISNNPIDIFVCGSMGKEKAFDTINKYFNFNERIDKYPETQMKEAPQETKKIVEELNVNQGKLSLGLRTNIKPGTSQYYSLLVYNSILGGGPQSKLFNNVREKLSLAYYVFSRLEKFKGLMLISSGIEINNFQKAFDEINNQMNEIASGNITENEFMFALSSIENSLKSIKDSQGQIIDFYQSQLLSGGINSIEEVIGKVKEVRIEDIKNINNLIKLDTVYFLKNKE